MKSYLINLDRRVDRWNYVKEHLADHGIKVTRFSAIDTKPGWSGCKQSHLAVMELCKDEQYFIIFEDDVEMIESADYVAMAIEQLPRDWDALYLGASPKEPQVRYSDNLFRLKNAHVTHCIMWHNRPGGAVEYIKAHKDEIRKIDDYFATVIQPKFNCFVCYPMVMSQKQFSSDTCTRSDVSTILSNYNQFCK
jgi:hypothetical protein